MKKERNKKNNDLTLKAMLGALAFLVSSIIILILANSIMPFSRFDKSPMIMQNYAVVKGVISILTLALSMYLTFIYLKVYLEVKSKFALGILVSVFAFTLFALVSNPFIHLFIQLGRGSMFLSIIPMIFATIGMATLAWVSSK